MGNRSYRYSVYENKRRRLEPVKQQMVSTITPTSVGDDSRNFRFFGLFYMLHNRFHVLCKELSVVQSKNFENF